MCSPGAREQAVSKRECQPVLWQQIRSGGFPQRPRSVLLDKAVDDDNADDYAVSVSVMYPAVCEKRKNLLQNVEKMPRTLV